MIKEDCIFCKIVNGQIESSKPFLYEDQHVVAVNDIKPKAPLHILIIPKDHIGSILEFEEGHKELLGTILLALQKVAQEKNLVDFKIVVNSGKYQEVKHLHFHLVAGENLDISKI